MPPPKTSAQGQPARPQRPGAEQPARPQRPGAEQPAAEQSGPGCAEGAGQQVLQHAVTATCWLDPGDGAQHEPASVRFSGRRTGISGRPQQGDRFERVETIHGLVPGGGPVSLTAKVSDVTPGEWIIWARPAGGPGQGRRTMLPPPAARRLSLKRFLWPKGNPVPSGSSGTRVTTRAGGFATGPGLVPASWVPLVALGVVVALVVQAVLASRAHLSVGAALAVSLAASVAGAAGARIWYVAVNRGKVQGIPTQGLCIQGFIVGAVAVLIPAVALAGLPLGPFLDVSAPGLFFGMAIGRQGCFLHGCCVGRLTSSRWGIWASDGRVGARRVPAQQLESLACLAIGLAALLLVLQARPPAAGTVFIGALAAYTVGRQVLFPYRAEARRSSFGRVTSMIAAGLVLVADVIVAIVA
jgi:phosphatidylglycerol:prolipoprotein diacylglycerol transferase